MKKLQDAIKSVKKDEASPPATDAKYIESALKHYGVPAVLQVINHWLSRAPGSNVDADGFMQHKIGRAQREIEDHLAGKD